MNIDWSSVLPWVAHVLLVLTTLGGLVGSFVPAFPGAVLVWGGALVHGLMTGWTPLGLRSQLILAGLAAVAGIGQLAISAAGAKRFGSSGWGVFGAGVGMLVGTFVIPIPVVGMLIGAFLGALACELWIAQPKAREAARAEGAQATERPDVRGASKAGVGAALGAVVGMMAEIGVAFVMVAVIVGAVVF